MLLLLESLYNLIFMLCRSVKERSLRKLELVQVPFSTDEFPIFQSLKTRTTVNPPAHFFSLHYGIVAFMDNVEKQSLTHRKNSSNERKWIPGKTPAKPSAFSMSSSTGNDAIASSLFWPSSEDEGYMFVPIPRRRPVSFAMANWSPVREKVIRFRVQQVHLQFHDQ